MTSPRLVTLVLHEPRGALPPFTVDSPWWMESGPVVEAARARFGLEIVVVRLLEGDRFPGGPVTYLVECDGVDPDGLTSWTRDLPIDPRRPAYAEVGGVADLGDWALAALAAKGIETAGPVEQVRTWNLSCLLRIPSEDGTFWVKAVPEFFAHESQVVAALATVDVTLVPEVIAARPGAMVMREAGFADGYDVDPDRHFAAVRRLHAATTSEPLPDGLVGIPRFDLDAALAALVDLEERHGADLTGDEQRRLSTLIGETPERWSACALELRLVHGDLHGGNLRLAPDAAGDVVIDWGDATITHPLFELGVLDSYTPGWPPQATDRWLELIGGDRGSWDAFRPLASVRPAMLYRRFCDRIEASEAVYHRDDILPALRAGLKLL